jgi:hypothetical protein
MSFPRHAVRDLPGLPEGMRGVLQADQARTGRRLPTGWPGAPGNGGEQIFWCWPREGQWTGHRYTQSFVVPNWFGPDGERAAIKESAGGPWRNIHVEGNWQNCINGMPHTRCALGRARKYGEKGWYPLYKVRGSAVHSTHPSTHLSWGLFICVVRPALKQDPGSPYSAITTKRARGDGFWHRELLLRGHRVLADICGDSTRAGYGRWVRGACAHCVCAGSRG